MNRLQYQNKKILTVFSHPYHTPRVSPSMEHALHLTYREPEADLPPHCTERDFSTLLHIIRLIPADDMAACHYLKVTRTECQTICDAWPHGWELLCRLIEAQAASITGSQHHDEEDSLVRHLTHLSVDEHDELHALMGKMHVSCSHTPTGMTDVYSANYDLAYLYYLCCSLTRLGRAAASLTLEQLHHVRVHINASAFFERRYAICMKKWPSPLLGHTSSLDPAKDQGLHMAQYIPFISLMLWRQLYMDRDFTNWAVLFWVGGTMNTNTYTDLAEQIEKMDETIEKIIVVTSVADWFVAEEGSPDFADVHDSTRLLCVLVSRRIGMPPFVTMLDRRWAEPMFGERNDEYIKLMEKVGRAAGLTPVNIVLSQAASEWVMDQRFTDRSWFKKGVRFFNDKFKPLKISEWRLNPSDDEELERKTLATDMDWLTDMLSIPMIESRFYWDDHHRAHQHVRRTGVDPADTDHAIFVSDNRWLKLFEPAMYITVCIGEHHYMNSPSTINAHLDEMFETVSTVNMELATCILTGDVVLTPATLTYLRHKTAPHANTAFHIIDGQTNPPPITYAWALSSRRDRTIVSCMRHTHRQGEWVDSFEWDEEAEEEGRHTIRDSSSDTARFVTYLQKMADRLRTRHSQRVKRARAHDDDDHRRHKR